MRVRHILAADIGGTNCRFALFRHDGSLELLRTAWSLTEGLCDLGDVLGACARSGLEFLPQEADAVVLAVAGPVDGLRAQTTNARLALDLTEAARRHGLHRIRLVNDFEAQAHACLTFPGQTARPVLEAAAPAAVPRTGRKAVIGAGTGLGTASLVFQDSGTWLALPAEGGHAAFPFVGPEEAAFEAHVRRAFDLPFVRGDDVLTGRGLALLHGFLEGEQLSPEEVARKALQAPSQTLVWFSRFLARMCRDWTLNTLCRGGLYIAGGIAAKNPLIVDCPSFADEYYTSPQHAGLLRTVPVWLVTDGNSGLWGAADIGCAMLGV